MYRFEILDTVEKMLPHLPLLQQLPTHEYDETQYMQMLSEMIPNGYSQVAVFEEDKCVGVAGYWINTKLFTGKYAELDNVLIDKDYRSKGIGEELCSFIEKDAIAKGCKYIVLDCFLENNRAQEFYNKLGYVAKGYHMIKKVISRHLQ